MGELARLGVAKPASADPRPEMLRTALARAPKVTLVVKGANTLVGHGDAVFVNDTGNPGLATAGSGDVLAGVVGALLAAGLAPWDAARLGVRLHGRAGDLAAAKVGAPLLIATDVLEHVPFAIAERLREEDAKA